MTCSKAIVLVGGLGTRLRPLTNVVPKPLVPIAGEPLMTRILRRLRAHGFSTVVLAVQYLGAQFRAAYGDGSALGLDLRIVEEPLPLGTAGAVRFAAEQAAINEPVLILNGDELSALDWTALCQHHALHQPLATIAVRTVADPSAYGVVVCDAHGRVTAWQEKPAPGTALANTINSGAYVLEPAAIAHIAADQFAMLERDLFPRLLSTNAHLQALPHTAYSQDIGTLAGYLAANAAVLSGALPEYQPLGRQLAAGVWVADNVTIDPSAQLQPPIMLGSGTSVGPRAQLQQVIAWEHVTIEADTLVRAAALATGSCVEHGQTVTNAALAPALL